LGLPQQILLDQLGDLKSLEAGVHDYIHYYNHERTKLGLKGRSPVEYRLASFA
jgi:putative transposase